LHELAQLGEAVAGERYERRAVVPPEPVDLASVASGAEQQVGVEPKQTVAAAHFAALDRFEQEIAAPGLDQLERGADGRFGVGDELAPDERRLARGEAGLCLGGIFGQRAGQGWPQLLVWPVTCAVTASIAAWLRSTPTSS
jgi:hypothetical protein